MSLETSDMRTARRWRIIEHIIDERHAQDAKWGPGIPDEGGMLAVLMEEVGEVATEVLHIRAERPGSLQALRAELVQVAAVAVKMIEGIDAEMAGEPLPPREAH